jgi:hypothetical protein
MVLAGMDNYAPQLELLVELENRHDELLQRLADLDKQVEQVLKEWLSVREAAKQGG